jgi:SAM-dependent methyltransferase
MTIHHNCCPSCKSDKISSLLVCRDHLVTRESFTVTRCDTCGFIFTQDYPDQGAMARYYQSEDYISHTGSSRNLFEKLYSAARKIMLRSKSGLIRKACGRERGKILDIGSGTGNFVHAMRKAGWDSTGVEINEKARDLSVSKLGINAISPEEINSLLSESFDCITLWHVLEHFHDPDWYFSEISRLLKRDGKIVIALPNCASLDASHYKDNWAAWDVPRHIWHFNPQSFALFAKQRGYTVQMKKYLPFDVFYISILSERQKGSLISLPAGLVRGLIFSLKTLFNTDRGSSLVYVLKREGS